jgi:FKBP-type peptidyl-prolyl cis-trans isomerase SlyD
MDNGDGDKAAAQVTGRSVVGFHYEMRDDGGELLESSRGGEPVVVLQGRGAVVPGVDDALPGHRVGDRFDLEVPPEQGYGMRVEGMIRRVSKKHLLAPPKRLRAGMQVDLRSDHQVRPVTLVKVGSSMVDVDLNHPLAGQTLSFSIEIVSLRDADAEELAHGHVHGEGGHHH